MPDHGLALATDDAFGDVLRAAQRGDESAVGELWRRHQPRLLRFLRTQAPRDAEDLASETWIDAARNLHSFEGSEDGFRSWLFTIARRRVIDHLRRRERRLHEVGGLPVEAPPAPSAENEAMSGSIGDEATARILELLPPDQAEIVLLRVVADLSVAQVAEITGFRPGTVRVTQHRALRRLAEALAPVKPPTPPKLPQKSETSQQPVTQRPEPAIERENVRTS